MLPEEKTRDFVWRLLRPALVVVVLLAFVWVFIQPPSFAGLPTMLLVLLGAVLITIVTAWVITRLTGEEMDESEWRRLVDRSDLLAQLPPPQSPPSEFDALVLEAISNLPLEFQNVLRKVPVTISRDGSKVGAYGLYVGATIARDTYPDHIVIYEDTLERDFGHDKELLRFQVERVVRHELAHHLGWDERGVRELGL